MSITTGTSAVGTLKPVVSMEPTIETVFDQKISLNDDANTGVQKLFAAIKAGLFVECFRILEVGNVDVNFVDKVHSKFLHLVMFSCG